MKYEIHLPGSPSAATLIGSHDTFAAARAAYDANAHAWTIIPAGRADELKQFGNLYSVAPRYGDGMYVVREGDGFSCLGFQVAERKGRAVAAWAGVPFGPAAIGTPEHFAAYTAAMAAGAEHARRTGTRCPVELKPELIPFEGKRVCVTYPDGEIDISRALLAAGYSKGGLVQVERHIRLSQGLDQFGAVVNRCFLEFAAEARGAVAFSRIAMNPPFSDVRKHVAAAISLLESGGTLVALVPITFERDGCETLETLPDDTFSTARVRTKIVRYRDQGK